MIISLRENGKERFMLQIVWVRKFMYISAFSLIIIPACDVRKTYNPMLFVFGIILLTITALISGFKSYGFKVTKTELKVWTIWIVLLISLFPAYIVGNISFSQIAEQGLIFILYFIVLAKSDLELLDLFVTAVVTNLYMIYRCFFELGIMESYYQGTMINPNQMALVLIGGAIGSLYIITSFNSIIRFLGLFVFSTTVVLIYYTSSRTIMLTLVFSCIIYVIYYIDVKKNINILDFTKTRKFFVVLCCSVFLIFYFLLRFREEITMFLFAKWGNDSSRLLSGRTEIWNDILKNMSLTGNYKSLINSNNDFMDWLVKYGVISFCAYIILIITLCFISIKRYQKMKNNGNIWIVIVMFTYLCISIFENIHAVFGKSINIMFWCVMGFAIRQEKTLYLTGKEL
jgi:hypothetical protein